MLCTFQVFLGAQAGMTLLIFNDWKSRIVRWLGWSAVTGAIGALLCLASQNDGWIPVNKNLWYIVSNLYQCQLLYTDIETKTLSRNRSLSYVMVTTCFAFFLLSFCYFLIDVLKLWTGAPFFYPGCY